jgi:AP-3 complex subunit beta
MATGAALATAASRLSARLQENLSEAARDFGFNNGLDLLANSAAKHLEAGALSTDEAHKETKRLLESARDKEKEEGLRRVLALVSRNRPASIYFPLVTSCLSSNSFNVRSLVSVYILRQAQLEPDLALMSVNMFQKDLNDPNPAIRAMALRVLCGMALEPITGLVITSLKRSSRDTNWFVRKTVAACLVNLWHQDEAHLSSVLPILTTLLSDKSALVAGSAMATFNAVCPDHLDFLHPHYRHLCRALLDADEWGQTSLLATLTRYARRNLEKPSSSKQNLDTDLDLLLRCSEPLLQSKNPAVVMSVVRLFFDLAPASFHSKTLRPLLRLLHISSELQEVVLADLVVLTSLFPDLYSSSYPSFFVRSSDTATSKRFKLYCLVNLINSLNAHAVLAEFKLYAQDPDPAFAGEAIKAIGMCALKRKEVAAESSKALLGFLHSRNGRAFRSMLLGTDVLQTPSYRKRCSLSDTSSKAHLERSLLTSIKQRSCDNWRNSSLPSSYPTPTLVQACTGWWASCRARTRRLGQTCCGWQPAGSPERCVFSPLALLTDSAAESGCEGGNRQSVSKARRPGPSAVYRESVHPLPALRLYHHAVSVRHGLPAPRSGAVLEGLARPGRCPDRGGWDERRQ